MRAGETSSTSGRERGAAADRRLPRRRGRGRPISWPRVFRIVYQASFLLLFVGTLALMTEEGIRRFPVRWLFHLDPLAALAVLVSSWILPAAFLWSLALVALTVVFGRAFCGWLCPVGTMNHLISWATRRWRRGPPAAVNRWRPHFRWKYLILIALLSVTALGSLQVGLLDPISLGLRSIASSLLSAGSTALPGDGFRPRIYRWAWLTGALFLAMLAANVWIARWWCRALCPLGALLGWIARGAIYRIEIDPQLCTHCDLCAADCQGADEPFARHRVSECHVCLNCIDACPEAAIRYRPFAPAAAPAGGVALPRRRFLGAALTGAALLPLFRASAGSASSPRPDAIRPPGALAEPEFLARCLRCGACGNACPTSAIQPALGEAGIEGLWTPVVVPRRGWCEPSCTLCGQVCPSGAIRPLTLDEKGWTRPGGYGVRIGTAFVDRGRCLPWAMDTPCIVCQEVCPTTPKAIRLEEVGLAGRRSGRERLQRPLVDPSRCVGCGLCEAKCPVVDLAAIRITRAGESRSPESAFTLGAPRGAAPAGPRLARCWPLLIPALLSAAAPAAAAGRVRPPALAGSWYPGRACLVSAEVDRMVRASSGAPRLPSRPIALVVPHAGWRYSGFAAAAAWRNLQPGDFDRVVMVAPSHGGGFSGYSVPDVLAYRTPAGEVPLCREAMGRLKDGRLVRTVAGAHEREHSIEIELPFLQERLDRFCLVPILTGRTDPAMQRALAKRLARLHDGRTLFAFSSDFTHYGPRYAYAPYGPSAMRARARIRALDQRAIGFLSPPDADGFRKFLEETSDTICGREGIEVLLELMPRIAPEARAVRLAHYASIDIPGFESDESVSYVALAYLEGGSPGAPTSGRPLGAPPPHPRCPADAPPLDPDLGAGLLRVARATLRTELLGGDDLKRALRDLPSSDRAALQRLQGTFVTLRRTDPEEIARRGRLRGCIGQVYPSYTLPEAVVVAAARAALQDPRFPPLRPEELPRIEIELTVLWPPRPVASWKEIEIGRDGIVLKKGERRAVFLPQVPVEQGWSLERTLAQLSMKAGLPPDAWRRGASFEIFHGQVFGEGHDRPSGERVGEERAPDPGRGVEDRARVAHHIGE
ncbi:MAG: AmmeMemoRadiSam system protein B, partial [Acidobacteriota bacterium]